MRSAFALLVLALCAVACTAVAAQESPAGRQQATPPRDTSADAALPAPAPGAPTICTLIYAPVCGTDKVTYPNKCVAASRGASIAYAGPCEGAGGLQEGGATPRRPYSFGRPKAAPAPAPAPAASALAASSAAAAAAPAPRLSLSPSSLAAARRAQPLNSELAAAAAAAASEAESSSEEAADPVADPSTAAAAAAPALSAAEEEAEIEAAEAELEAEIEEASSREAAAEEAEAADDDDAIILAPPAPSRPVTIAACPRIYMPVCATVPSTGVTKTFDNDCLARAEGASVARPGACSGAGTKSPGGVIVPTTTTTTTAAASSPFAAEASLGAAAAPAAAAPAAAAASKQPPATRGAEGSSSSSGSSSFSSFAAQRSPPSTRYRLPAIESSEEQERLDVGSGGEV